MKIFIDLDNTLFNTKSVLAGKLAGDLLLAELQAPLFKGAKEALEELVKAGHQCYAITQRGISDEEIKNTELRLKLEGLKTLDGTSLISDVIYDADYKYEAIKKFCKWTDPSEKKEALLIDDDFIAGMYSADHGLPVICFYPRCAEDHNALKDMNLLFATSWDEIANVVLNREVEQG